MHAVRSERGVAHTDPLARERRDQRRCAAAAAVAAGGALVILVGGLVTGWLLDGFALDIGSLVALALASKVRQGRRGAAAWLFVVLMLYAASAVFVGGAVAAGLSPIGADAARFVAAHRELLIAGSAALAAWAGGAMVLVWLARSAARRIAWRCAGECDVCGYDLEGSGGGRCPECGAAHALRRTAGVDVAERDGSRGA